MKRIYLIALSMFLGFVASAQISKPVNAPKLQLTRDNTSALTANREQARSNAGNMRVTILEQDFQTTGNIPGDMPAGWITNDVTYLDLSTGPSFFVHNSTTANAGGYWPVAEIGTDNRFAGANDDSAPCDCTNDESYVESPSMNFASASNPAVTFDIYHDGNFGGGDAWLQASTDGGASWIQVNYVADVNGVFPVVEGVWQTLVITLFEFSTQADVRLRFTWSDAGSWASGFAVDNIVVGDLETYSLTLDRTVQGDWNSPVFGDGYWDYTQIPIAQADSVKGTGVLSNTGLNALTNARFEIEIFQGSNSMVSATSASVSSLASLTKDTVSVVAGYIPDALGVYTITGTAVSDDLETDNTDNNSAVTFEVSECTYARDLNSAQAFFALAAGDFAGNLFDIYNDEEYTGIQLALGSQSLLGGTVAGAIYVLTGFDTVTGEPIFEYVDGTQTQEADVLEENLNFVGDNQFICLPFDAPFTLTPGVYLAAVIGTDALRIPVSGTNAVPASWVYTDATATYGWTQGVFMIRMVGACQSCSLPGAVHESIAADLNANAIPNPASSSTQINFNLEGSALVDLTVHDITGKLMEFIKLGNRAAGNNKYELNVSNYAAGLYTYTISSGNSSVTNRLVVE